MTNLHSAIRYQLAFLFSRKEFYISCSTMLAIVTVHFILSSYLTVTVYHSNIQELMLPYAYHLPLEDTTIPYEYIMILLFPLLGGFMFSDSWLIERAYRMDHLINIRLGYKNNVYAKIIVTFAIVFLTIFLCLGFNAILNYLFYAKENLTDIYGHHVYNLEVEGYSMFEYVRVHHLNLYVFFNIFKFSFYCAMLSLMSFGISLHITNRILVNFSILLFLLISHIAFSLLHLEHLSIISTLNFSTRTQLMDLILSISYLILLCFLLLKSGMQKRMVGL